MAGQWHLVELWLILLNFAQKVYAFHRTAVVEVKKTRRFHVEGLWSQGDVIEFCFFDNVEPIFEFSVNLILELTAWAQTPELDMLLEVAFESFELLEERPIQRHCSFRGVEEPI